MPLPGASPASAAVTALLGRPIIGGIRRLLIVSVVTALLYPAFMVSSAGYCAGGYDASGGFIDAAGQAVDEAPRCVQLTLGPSSLVYVAIAIIVIVSIGRVENAADDAAALRTLRLGAWAVILFAVIAIVISQVWFRLVPIEDFANGAASILSPFPFGLIEVSNDPMPAP